MTHDQIETQLEINVDAVTRATAQEHLNLFRQELALWNLKRHPLRVVRKCGMTTLMVGDRLWYELRPGTELIDLLIHIGARIESSVWGHHLERTTL